MTAPAALGSAGCLQDEFYNRFLVRNNLFEPVIEMFLANGSRYNLLNSAVLELVDFVRKVRPRDSDVRAAPRRYCDTDPWSCAPDHSSLLWPQS